MKIIVCHNYYQQSGGESQVFSNEVNFLRRNGLEVVEYVRNNDELRGMSQLSIMRNLFWNPQVYREIKEIIRREKPDILHVHNFFPLISPAVFYAARDCGVPAVAVLNNQRLMCPGSSFTRNEQLCTDCVGNFFAVPGVFRRCYRNSLLYSMGVASMFMAHRILKTWDKVVSGYITSTEFYKDLFVRHGLPSQKIYVKPHIVEDPGYAQRDGRYALFIGRLDPEKGSFFLLRVWDMLHKLGCECPLFIRGSGQCEPEMQSMIKRQKLAGITFIPPQSREALVELMRNARFVIVPSRGLYETFSLVVAEAFACGIPVVAPRRGVFEEIITDTETGILFNPDSVDSCVKAVQWAWEHPRELIEMGKRARRAYEERYTPEKNYYIFQDIYRSVISAYQSRRSLL